MARVALLSLLVFSVLAAGPAPVLAQGPGSAPVELSAEKLQPFRDLPADPAPEALTRDSHYWVSNEYRLELFEPHVRDLGGIYVGVGTDQNYLMCAWAKCEVLVLMDFDQAIPDLHKVYAVMFREAPDPAKFMALWGKDNVKQVETWLRQTYAEDSRLERIVKAYKVAGPSVNRRLKLTLKSMQKLGLKTFMDDAGQYQHVRDLWANGRVFPVRGDLTGNLTMKAIGAAAKQLGMPVRVLYPSNAEQYFDFTPEYRENVNALPMDERSRVVRTLGWGVYGMADPTYHYNVQVGPAFQRWLAETKIKNAGKMLHYRTPQAEKGFSTFEQTPDVLARKKPVKEKQGE